MSPSSSKRNSSNGNSIDKLDYIASPRRPLLAPDSDDRDSNRHSQDTSYAGSFFEQVAEGIMERDRERLQREVARWLSFIWAVINCLCAGSITAFSLYGHIFQTNLHYTQFQVNIVSVVAELGMYLLVPAFGFLCDRWGPGAPSALSGLFFGFGYILAAFAYKSGPPPSADGNGWPFSVMVLAFAGIGLGTSCMYLSAVTTCAKNFGRGNAKGIALAVPIAAFGLSGMWQSQIGSKLLYVRNPDGTKGDVDVFRYFLFLGILLLCVGTIGYFTLQIIDEEELIDEAVEELERSGLLAHDEFFTQAANHHGYGTIEDTRDLSDSTFDFLQTEAERLKAHAEEEARKKTWLLNEETRRYVMDPTMWWMAAGFMLVTGPGEAFINNLGTIIGTLTPPHVASSTSPATHVSIVAITSTIARLVTGTLTDLLAPVAPSYQHHRGPDSVTNSLASLPSMDRSRRFSVSRITFFLAFSFLLSLGQVLLASGWVQNHVPRFAVVSAFIGAGYGAVFSLAPIVVSVVWGVENFGTNWGILAMTPAVGTTIWSAVYAAVYQKAASTGEPGIERDPDDVLCYGRSCYAPTFWAMAISVWVAMGLWLWAWRGPGGWKKRGIAV